MGKDLRYNIIHPGKSFENEFDFLETLLKEDGIAEEDLNDFLRPTKKLIHDPFLMKNMDKAVKLVHDHIEKGSKILVKPDVDYDGYSSSAELIQFLWTLDPKADIEFVQDFNKSHGLKYEDVCDHTRDYYGLIIIPDASMTLYDAKIISGNFDSDILILDHHLVEVEDGDSYVNYCVAVNCTDGQYPNPSLSGCGVVQKFIEAYVDTYKLDPAIKERWLDLTGSSIIADNMTLKNLENRYYVMEGIKRDRQTNDLLNEIELRTKEEDEWRERCIKTVGWKIAPLINGCIRYGEPNDQTKTFQALCGWKEDVEYQPRRKHKEDPLPEKEIHTLQWDVARNLVNIKARQDKEVRKFSKDLEAIITEQGLDKNSIIFVDGTKVLTKGTVTGMIANKLASIYMRPALVMRQKNSLEFGGSMRGYNSGPIENTKEFLESTGLITLAGHENSAGISLKKEDLPELIRVCNEKCDPSEVGIIYDCDWEIPAPDLKREYVEEVGMNYQVFGGDIPSPLFLIKGLEINASEIQAYGDTKSFIRFTYNGIPFVKKFCKSTDYDDMTGNHRGILGTNRKKLKLDIVGEFQLSKYEDNLIPQIKIVDFKSEEIPQEETMWADMPEIKREIIKKDDDFDW